MFDELPVPLLLLLMLLSSCAQLSNSQDVCLTTGDISQCSSFSSVWAINSPQLEASYNFNATKGPLVTVNYVLVYRNSTRLLLCTFVYYSATCDVYERGHCGSCFNSHALNGSLVAKVLLPETDTLMTGAVLQFSSDNPVIANETIQNLTFSECPASVGHAHVINYTHPCGYGCCERLACETGYKFKEEADSNSTYCCTAAAKWTVPVDFCVADVPVPISLTTPDSDVEPTEKMTDVPVPITLTTPDSDVEPTEKIADPKDHQLYQITGIVVGIFGIANITVAILLQVYMVCGFSTSLCSSELKVLHVVFICFSCVWAIGLGVCVGLPDDNAPFIAGTVLGALSIARMTTINVLYVFRTKKMKYKGSIKGKRAKDVSMD